MTGFFKNLKTLLLSYPDKNYVDWNTIDVKQSNHASLLSMNMLHSHEPGVTAERCCDSELVVSLSTYGKRIHGVALTIETLMEQTVKPNRIILNLGREFEGKGRIPGSVRLLERRGLEVRFVRDQGPYTKLLPTLSDFPDATIITVDDDMFYDFDLVSNMVNEHLNHPDDVIASRCRVMDVGSDSRLRRPFLDWDFASSGDSGMNLLPEGVRGILYPAGSLDERVFDEALFSKLCPTTDDFWFKAMAMLKGVEARACYCMRPRFNLCNPMSAPDDTLHQRNKTGAYDEQLEAVLGYFGLK